MKDTLEYFLNTKLLITNTHLSIQPLVCGIKNLLFLDRTFVESEAILDKVTSDVAVTAQVIIERTNEIFQRNMLIFLFSKKSSF